VNVIIDNLISLSRSPRPSTWTETLSPLVRRADVVAIRHLGQRAEHAALADQIALVDMVKLTTRVKPDALPYVGKLVALGKDLRAALDANFVDLRDAVRSAVAATQEPAFVSACEQIERYLPRAEAAVQHIDDMVTSITALVAKLAVMEYVSTSVVVPKRDGLFLPA
jgi:hypothetical protein